MTIFDAVRQARDEAVAAGIQPNAVRLGDRQWEAIRRALAEDSWPECLDMHEPGKLFIHGLWVHLETQTPDLLEVFVYLEVTA